MKIVYVGRASGGVRIAATGQHAPKGEPIDVPDELGESLLEQESSWRKPTAAQAKKSDTKTTKAADVADTAGSTGKEG